MGNAPTTHTYTATGGPVTVPGQVNPIFNIAPVVTGTAITSTDGINFNLAAGHTYICTATVVDLTPYVSIQFMDNTTATTFGLLTHRPPDGTSAVTITGHLIVAIPTVISVVIVSNTDTATTAASASAAFTSAFSTPVSALASVPAFASAFSTPALSADLKSADQATAKLPSPPPQPVCQISIIVAA